MMRRLSIYFTFKLKPITFVRLRTCVIAIILVMIMTSCSTNRSSLTVGQNTYTPVDQDVYNTIAGLDSIFWKAYNNCDMETQSQLYSDNIEFYHDQAGLIASKQLILDATKANICGKIRRDLVKGSLEVYPIPGFGAVEIGKHTFQSTTDKDSTPSQPGNFVIIWKQVGIEWVITKVISLH